MRRAVLILISMAIASGAFAQSKTFIREYHYKASETDSKVVARQKALKEVKALLIEELGTYVESYVNYQVAESKNQITKDFFTSEIKTLSAGTTETKILEETWNGYEYYVKAQIAADPEEVVRRINETLSKRKSSEVIDSLQLMLKGSNAELALKGKEIDVLKAQVLKQKGEVDSKEKSLLLLKQQLATTNQQLASFKVEETKILSEIEQIQGKIKDATKRAGNARRGMTIPEAFQVCGRPRSTDGYEDSDYFCNYGEVWVMFESGILTTVFNSKLWRGIGSSYTYKENNIIKD